jgi:uncharacterized protein
VSVYFFDSSGLVKRYANEAGTNWVKAVADPTTPNSIYIAEITGVEVISAVMRKVRESNISKTDALVAIADFRLDFNNHYDVLETRGQIVSNAMTLVEKYPLRAYDAVQLAVALEVNALMPSLGLPTLTFVCADNDLIKAATVEGLVVENPNNYP